MVTKREKELIDEHVRLITQFVGGNQGAAARLTEIEKELGLTPCEIASKASEEYLRSY